MKMDQRRKVKVIAVEDGIIEFEENWFFKGETLFDADDKDHDITLEKQLNDKKFTYRGLAKVGEYYQLY